MKMSFSQKELEEFLKSYFEQKNEGSDVEVNLKIYYDTYSKPDGWGFYEEYGYYKLSGKVVISKKIKILNNEKTVKTEEYLNEEKIKKIMKEALKESEYRFENLSISDGKINIWVKEKEMKLTKKIS